MERYTPKKWSLFVPTRKAPKAVMVSPGIGGKTFSTNALKPNKKYIKELGSEFSKARKLSRYVKCFFSVAARSSIVSG